MKNKSFEFISKVHPCFSKKPNVNNARLHLPVAPGCNIACKFCIRSTNDYEDRPAVASKIISPKEAKFLVDKAVNLCSNLKVVGISGPGDTLVTDNAIETFKLIKGDYQDLLPCLSTNGLLLEEKVQELYEVGVKTITVTVNAVDPLILMKINDRVFYKGKLYKGIESAKILIDKQLKGIRKCKDLGMIVKINSVLITEINSNHIQEIAKKISKQGADIMNIIPLIPQHELSNCSKPTCEQITEAKIQAKKYIEVFEHCKRCRADAFGVPGVTELRDELYGDLKFEDTFSHG